MTIDYTSRLINSLNRPYMEFWRLVEKTGQTRFSGLHATDNIQACLRAIVSMIASNRLYLKYQVYRKEDGALLGFFDPSKVYRGITVENRFYMQNDTINVLVLTKISSDTILRPGIVRDRTMITTQINQPLQRYELW